jgi:hypothetical protein
MHKITINIGLDGVVNADAQGFKGKTCEDATNQILLLLGGEAESKKKPDYYASPASTAQILKRVF